MKKIAVYLLLLVLLLSFITGNALAASGVNRQITVDTDKCTLYFGQKVTVKADVSFLDDSAPKNTTLVWNSSNEELQPLKMEVSSESLQEALLLLYTQRMMKPSAGEDTITALQKKNDSKFSKKQCIPSLSCLPLCRQKIKDALIYSGETTLSPQPLP